jgi:hypothetical protein
MWGGDALAGDGDALAGGVDDGLFFAWGDGNALVGGVLLFGGVALAWLTTVTASSREMRTRPIEDIEESGKQNLRMEAVISPHAVIAQEAFMQVHVAARL